MIRYDMTGKVALITGGTSGIGRATAQAFVNAGAQVLIVGRNSAKGRDTVAELNADGAMATFVQADMASQPNIRRLFNYVQEQYGRLDFAVNNAAGEAGIGKGLHQFDEADFDQTMNVNLKGVWWCMKYEIEQLLKQPTGGAIVNVSSVNGLGGVAGGSLYAASKAAVIGLTKSAALELARTPIRVNALVPGFVDTPLLKQAINAQSGSDPGAAEAVRRQFEAFVPQGRIATPDQAANAILWLCSGGASAIIGHSLILDGGLSASFR